MKEEPKRKASPPKRKISAKRNAANPMKPSIEREKKKIKRTIGNKTVMEEDLGKSATF